MKKKMKKSSRRFRLNSEELRGWLRNTALFSAPAVLAVLLALQSGQSHEFAIGAGYSALLAAAIDITKKFLAGQK